MWLVCCYLMHPSLLLACLCPVIDCEYLVRAQRVQTATTSSLLSAACFLFACLRWFAEDLFVFASLGAPRISCCPAAPPFTMIMKKSNGMS